jgi:hypothetical protein
MVALFVSFGTKSLLGGGKFVQDKDGNSNSPQADNPFFPNLYKFHNLHIFMDFYLILSSEVCTRSS